MSDTASDVSAGSDQDTKTGSDRPVSAVFSGAEWVRAYSDDSDILCVWFDITNNTGGYIMPAEQINVSAVQNGMTVNDGIYISPESGIDEEDNIYRYIRPGSALRCVSTFACSKDAGNIEVTAVLTQYFAADISVILDPDELPGAPEESLKEQVISDITWLDGIPEEGEYMSYYVSIDSYDTYIDRSGRNILRVWFTIKNNSGAETDFYTSVFYRAVQDGCSLKTKFPDPDDPDELKQFQNIKVGGELKVCIDWISGSDSPAAVELFDPQSQVIILGKVAA